MPLAKPTEPDTYLCTTIRLDTNNTYYIGNIPLLLSLKICDFSKRSRKKSSFFSGPTTKALEHSGHHFLSEFFFKP